MLDTLLVIARWSTALLLLLVCAVIPWELSKRENTPKDMPAGHYLLWGMMGCLFAVCAILATMLVTGFWRPGWWALGLVGMALSMVVVFKVFAARKVAGLRRLHAYLVKHEARDNEVRELMESTIQLVERREQRKLTEGEVIEGYWTALELVTGEKPPLPKLKNWMPRGRISPPSVDTGS